PLPPTLFPYTTLFRSLCRLLDLRFGLLLPGWGAGRHQLRHEPAAFGAYLPAHGAAHHLPARLAAGVERDHHHLRSDFPAAGGLLRDGPALLRGADRAESSDVLPDAPDGHGGLLSEGNISAPCPTGRYLQGHHALCGHG